MVPLLGYSDTKMFIKARFCLGFMDLIYDTLRSPLLNSQRELHSLGLHTMYIFLQVKKPQSQNQRQVVNIINDLGHLSSIIRSVKCRISESRGHPGGNYSITGFVLPG